MDIETAIEHIAAWGDDDWIGLWLIAQYVADDLEIEDREEALEATLAIVRGLLTRGFRAGPSPVENVGVKFVPWREQDPDAVLAFIRREWMRRDDFPSWGDPWFAAGRFCRLDA